MKKLFLILALLWSTVASAQFSAGQILTAAQLNSQFALYAPVTGVTFTGPVNAITQSPGNNTTLVATTQFVTTAVAAGVAGVASFNTRTGAVTLTSADVTGAGGATAAQATTALAATGGSINGVTVGATTPSTGSFTALTGSSSVSLANRTISATTAAAATDFVVLGNATSAAITYTLPTAASSTNRIIVVQKIDSSANAVTVAPNGSDTINGGASKALGSQYGALTLQSNGTTWTILATSLATLG